MQLKQGGRGKQGSALVAIHEWVGRYDAMPKCRSLQERRREQLHLTEAAERPIKSRPERVQVTQSGRAAGFLEEDPMRLEDRLQREAVRGDHYRFARRSRASRWRSIRRRMKGRPSLAWRDGGLGGLGAASRVSLLADVRLRVSLMVGH
jgi:hypothetical protein